MVDSTTVLLVDDHALLRDTLKHRLHDEPDIDVVGIAGNADEALAIAQRTRPSVVVMDVDMPGLLCFVATKNLCAHYTDIHVIFLSGFSNDQYIENALDSGGLSYLTKEEPPETVIKAIRKAARGVAYFSPQVRARLVIDHNNRIRLLSKSKTRVSLLTNREIEILRYLAKGMAKKEIAQMIHRTYANVDKHAENIMRKLDIHDRVELARFAIREGLVHA